MATEQFEPRLVGFLCWWCSSQGADLAGTSRMKYPPNMIPIRVMCSGRVDPTFVLEAFRQGADGVLISGCHPGDCHYISGNYKTMARFPLLRSLIEQFGIEGDRLRLEFVSASEGDRFTQIVTEFVEQVRTLGPLEWKVPKPGVDGKAGAPEAEAETP